MRPTLFMITTLLLLLTTGTPSAAQEPPPPTSPLPAAADHPLVRQAMASLQAGDPAAAVRSMEALRDTGEATLPQLAFLGALYVEGGRARDALAILEPMATRPDADPAVLYNAGRAALALGQDDRAVEWLRRSAAQAPGSPASRELGLLEGRRGNLAGAFEHLVPWVKHRPDDLEARMAAALAAVRLRRLSDAQLLVERLPDTLRARLLRAEVAWLGGDPAATLSILGPLLESRPPEMEVDVRRLAAEAYLVTGRSAEAVAMLEGRPEFTQRPDLALILADAEYKNGNVATAVQTLQPFAERILAAGVQDPGQAQVLAEYGRMLFSTGRPAEAVTALRPALERVPEYGPGWQILGQALVALGREDEGREALSRFESISAAQGSETERRAALEAELENPDATPLGRIEGLLVAGRTDEALARVRQEIGLDPENVELRLMESRILVQMGALPAALSVLNRLEASAPDDARVYYQRGVVRMAQRDDGNAQLDLRRALELEPGLVAALNDLAIVLIREGELLEAQSLLQRALELNPDNRVAADNLAYVETQLGG